MDDLIVNFVVFVWIPYQGMIDTWAFCAQEQIKKWLTTDSY